MNTRHKHADLIKRWLDGHDVQYRHKDQTSWRNVGYFSDFAFPSGYEFRLKPSTFPIGEWEAPRPETKEPEDGDIYFVPDLLSRNFVYQYTWREDTIDKRALARGLVHLTKEAAFQHGRALAAFSENIENA